MHVAIPSSLRVNGELRFGCLVTPGLMERDAEGD